MTKLTLLTATAIAALIMLPGLVFTEAAEAQRRHDGNESGRSGVAEDHDRGRRGGGEGRGRGSSQSDRRSNAAPAAQPPAANPRRQQVVAPTAQRNSRGDARPSGGADRGSSRGDQWQNRGRDRGAPDAGRRGQGPGRGAPVMNPIDPRRQPAPTQGSGRRGSGPGGLQPDPATGRDFRGPRSRPDQPDTRRTPMGGQEGRGPRAGAGRPDSHTGAGGGYSPRGPRPDAGRRDSHTGTGGGYNPRGPRAGAGRPDSHAGAGGGYNPRGPRSGTVRPDSHTGNRGGYNPRGHRPGARDQHRGPQPGAYRNDHRRHEFAQRRRAFYHSDHRSDVRWLHHLNVGWNNSPYYGHYGPSTRWRYNSRYYDYGYNNRQFAYYDRACRYERNGNGTAIGAILGAIIGGAAADGDHVGAGILLGAGFGAVLGSAVSQLDDCDKVQFQYAMNYAFENGQAYYWGNPYSGVRGSIVIRESYSYANTECRWGDAEIYMPDGTYNYDRVRMCRDAYGDWEVARQQ